MSGRHAVPSRWGHLYREIAKFGLVGLSGFVINLGVFNLVRSVAHWQTVRASVLATAIAIMGNYLGLRYFAYRDQTQDERSRRKELVLFLSFSAIGLVIENSVLYATTYGFGWDSPLANNICKLVGIGIATVFRFWSYRTWVFRVAGGQQDRTVADSRGGAPAFHAPSAAPPEPLLAAFQEKA
ncbi:GtrA family protein [Streptomyces sp. NBC_00038]|uniref:GtrA family protein n=1 Tax=Streptomyces sp. NBC_00038 TaxID=2903615 RepID=UPI00224FA497|nr:GtrA family protein [Streptomyces sp. NBC_00038]MCX5560049.1 GtrA family protein [Streptomyces sp. NBC_00038]